MFYRSVTLQDLSIFIPYFLYNKLRMLKKKRDFRPTLFQEGNLSLIKKFGNWFVSWVCWSLHSWNSLILLVLSQQVLNDGRILKIRIFEPQCRKMLTRCKNIV